MGIKIAHDPVATPILASYATGVGRAREREAGKQRAMQVEYDRQRQRTALEFQRQNFQAGRDEANRNFMLARDEANSAAATARLDQQNKMYRDKDALASLEQSIRDREKAIGGANLDAQGRTYRDRFYADIAGVRAARDSSRPDAYYQRLGKVLKKYEDTPWDAHTVQPKTTSSFASEDAVYYDESGRPMTYDEARTRGAASVMFPGTKPGEFKVNSIGGRSSAASGQKKSISDMTEQEFFADSEEFDRAQKQAISMLKAQQGIDSGPITQDQIWGAMKGIYEKRRGPVQQGQASGAQQPTIGQKTPQVAQDDMQQQELANAAAAETINKYGSVPLDRLNPQQRQELAAAESQLNSAKRQLFQGAEPQVADSGGGTAWEQMASKQPQTAPDVAQIGVDDKTMETVGKRVDSFFSDLRLENADDWSAKDAGMIQSRAEEKLKAIVGEHKSILAAPQDVQMEYSILKQLWEAARAQAQIRNS